MTATAAMHARARQRGFTLVEVVVSLVILTVGLIYLLGALSGATERVYDTMVHRKMRYLMQLQAGDVEILKVKPDDDEERYEEGQTGNFEDFASKDNPTEYDEFQFVIEVYRDEVIVGGDDEEALRDAGFQTDASGHVVGRPVSNDSFGFGGENEEEEPPGQMKRLLVLSVRKNSEDADNDISFRVMTYLPMPGEEDKQVGGASSAAVGGAEGAKPGEGTKPPEGGADSGGRK